VLILLALSVASLNAETAAAGVQASRHDPESNPRTGADTWRCKECHGWDYKGVARFFSYLSSPEVQAEWHQGTGYLPITLAAYDLTKKQGFYDENPGTETALLQMTLNPPTDKSRGHDPDSFCELHSFDDSQPK